MENEQPFIDNELGEEYILIQNYEISEDDEDKYI